MDTKLTKMNKMGTMPIGKLLATMSLPAIFSMFVQALYNIVDSLFVARVSVKALEALSIAFPMQMIALSVALGIGVGTNTIVARRLGEGRKDDADKFAQTGLFMALICGALFIALGAFIPKLFMQAYSKDADVVQMGTVYLMICLMCTIAVTVEMTISKTLQGTGNMIIPMISQLIGAVTNIILDPIMIFVFDLGVTGAAIATVIGQFCAMTFVLIMAWKRSHIIQIYFKNFKIKLSRILIICKVGAPAMVMNAVGGFTTMLMNGILISYSNNAITVLGVYFKVQSFVFMPVFGLNQGALPILSFNFGANKKDRYRKTLLLSVIVALTIMILGTVLFQLAPELILKLFNADDDIMAIGTVALRAISLIFIPAGISIVISTAYQSLGYGFSSLMMSLLRQIVLLLPCAYLFGKLWGLDAIWYSYLVAEVIPMLTFSALFIFIFRKAFRKRAALYNDLADSSEGEAIATAYTMPGDEIIDENVIGVNEISLEEAEEYCESEGADDK